MGELSGEIALVTAAAGSGIGQAVARRYAEAGADVVVTDIHAGRTAQVAEAIAAEQPDVRVLGLAMDAGDRDAIDAVLDEVESTLGPVTVLVNNAAVNVTGSIYDYDPDDWERIVAVNLTGPWYLSRRVMRSLRDAGRGGVIVNMGTYAPDVGGYGQETAYATTKGGLNALTRCLAYEGGPHGIRANTISMGVISGTKFIDDRPEILEDARARSPLGAVATAQDIAELALYLASDRAATITGETVNVAAGSYMRT